MDTTPSEDIAQRAKSLIASNEYFQGTPYPLSFESYEKVLVVNGTVPTYYLKQLLQSTLGGLNGVERVVNQVSVDYGSLGS